MYEKDYKKLYEAEKEHQYWREHEDRVREHNAYMEREANRREREREMDYERNHVAHSWQQAFRKNVHRLQRELKESLEWQKEDKDNASGFDHASNIKFWHGEIHANQLANDLLDEELAFVAPIIAKLQAQIAGLERRARQ